MIFDLFQLLMIFDCDGDEVLIVVFGADAHACGFGRLCIVSTRFWGVEM